MQIYSNLQNFEPSCFKTDTVILSLKEYLWYTVYFNNRHRQTMAAVDYSVDGKKIDTAAFTKGNTVFMQRINTPTPFFLNLWTPGFILM